MLSPLLLSLALCGQDDPRPLAPRAGERWHVPPNPYAIPAWQPQARPAAPVPAQPVLVIVIRIETAPRRGEAEDTDPLDERPVIPVPKTSAIRRDGSTNHAIARGR